VVLGIIELSSAMIVWAVFLVVGTSLCIAAVLTLRSVNLLARRDPPVE
jgi:hypothetical protein